MLQPFSKLVFGCLKKFMHSFKSIAVLVKNKTLIHVNSKQIPKSCHDKVKELLYYKCNMVFVQNMKRVKCDIYYKIRNLKHSTEVA